MINPLSAMETKWLTHHEIIKFDVNAINVFTMNIASVFYNNLCTHIFIALTTIKTHDFI